MSKLGSFAVCKRKFTAVILLQSFNLEEKHEQLQELERVLSNFSIKQEVMERVYGVCSI
jgi:hypothetical protein